MRPLDELTAAAARAVHRVVFDLDDTVLTEGRLTEPAFAALFRLREVGLGLVACTGRPASFAEVVARQWPVDAAIGENGAIAYSVVGRALRAHDTAPTEERARRRARLAEVTAMLLGDFPELALADDQRGRVTDVAFDVGEHRRVARAVVDAARERAEAAGVRTFTSAIHLHLTLDTLDKASGYRALATALDEDAESALARAAFVGDSSNDGPAFAAFGLTFGVANVAEHLSSLKVPPMFVAHRRCGDGFAEIASRLVALRSGSRT